MRDPTSEEILAQCPETIDKNSIRLNKRNGRPRTGKANANGWHSEQDRIRAATVYAVTGNAARTSELTGVPAGTIRQWKTQEWWPQVIDRIRQEKDDELDVQFTKIVDKTIEQINDRIENGDYVYNVKTGELVRKPMGGKELGVVTSIFVDKRELIRGKKKQQMDQQSIKDKLDQIAKALRLKEPVTIEGEFTHAEEQDTLQTEATAEQRESSEVLV
jgi:RNA polymerase-binding transcription factor DksA